MARHELQSILKKSPIIIFSKSYCPYSKRAKNILLDLYEITPKPWVVELDQMTEMVPKKKSTNGDEDEGQEATLGKKVQDLLQSLTGRRTVPNIMINSQSLGGSDEVVKLDRENELSEKIKQMGGKRIVSVERKAGKES
jgi:glutaredoxin